MHAVLMMTDTKGCCTNRNSRVKRDRLGQGWVNCWKRGATDLMSLGQVGSASVYYGCAVTTGRAWRRHRVGRRMFWLCSILLRYIKGNNIEGHEIIIKRKYTTKIIIVKNEKIYFLLFLKILSNQVVIQNSWYYGNTRQFTKKLYGVISFYL